MAPPAVYSIRILNPWFLEQDHTGAPAAGYRVYTLVAGSAATLLTTYIDYSLTIPNTNPVVLNIYGEALIFTDQQYIKLVYTAPDGDLSSPIWTQDYVATAPYRDANAIGAASGTANNIYVVNTVPAYLSILDGFSLVMIPDITNLDTLVSQVFTGIGINDADFNGPYTGSTSSVFQVQIDGVGSPNTFKWRKDSGTWTTGVNITAAAQILQEGISITFSTVINHSLGDLWSLTVRPATYLNFCGLGADIIYKNNAGSLEVLSGGDIIAGIPAHLDYSLSQNCWILINPSLPSLSSLPRKISRRIITGDSNLVLTDSGNEVCYTGAGGHTLTLLACSIAADYVFDLVNAGTGDWIIQVYGGTDKITYPGIVGGVTKIVLNRTGRFAIRLVTNGVDWTIMSDAQAHGMAVLTGTGTFYASVDGFIFITACGGGGGGDVGANGGGAGDAIANFRFPVTGGTGYNYVVGDGGVAGANGDDTVFSTITLTGGTHGTASAGTGDDTNFGMGIGAPDLATGATGSGSGGCGGMFPSAGADGCLIIQW